MSTTPSITNMNKKAIVLKSIEKNTEIKGRSLWKDAFRRLSRNKAAVVSLFVLFFITILVIFAPLFSHYEMQDTDWNAIGLSPSFSNFSQSSSNSKHFTSSFILSCYISGLLITHSKLSSMSVPAYFKTSGESYPVGIINFSLSRSCG